MCNREKKRGVVKARHRFSDRYVNRILYVLVRIRRAVACLVNPISSVKKVFCRFENES